MWYTYPTLPRWLLISLIVATTAFPLVSEAVVVPARSDKESAIRYLDFYGELYRVPRLLRETLIRAESNWCEGVKNPRSSAMGCFQFIKSTWKAYCDGDILNPAHNIGCAMRIISQGGIGHWLADPNIERKIRPFLSSR